MLIECRQVLISSYLMKYKVQFLIFVLVNLLIISHSSSARVLTVVESINKAGQQRMLTQRIAKNYLTIANGIFRSESNKELKRSIAIFEDNLTLLSLSMVDESSKNALSELKKSWIFYHQLVLTRPNKENTDKVFKGNTKLLDIANNLVISLENYANKSGAKLVNISGRQRMLSQRIALYYFASYTGYKDDIYHQQLYAAVNEFDHALVTLMSAEENTVEISESLTKVQKQWNFYKPKFDNIDSASYIPRMMRIITEKILNDMDKITNLYEKNLSIVY